jgi:hypothetical protein
MKILLHSDPQILHTTSYEEFVKSALLEHCILVDKTTYKKNQLAFSLLKIASDENCDIIILLLLEQAISIWTLISIWKHSALHRKNKVTISGFYFKYDKFFGIKVEGVLLSFFFWFSGIDLILISDPLYDRRPLYSLLRSKFRYVCDPCYSLSPTTVNCNANRKSSDLSNNSLTIACLGYLSEKKSIALLLSALSVPRIIKTLRAKNIRFIMAGTLDPDILQKYYSVIKLLQEESILVLHNRFLNESELEDYIVFSDFTWCVQSSFNCSSGIFSRSVALGTSPIVQHSSILADICIQHEFGHIINFRAATPFSFDHFISQLTLSRHNISLERKGMKSYSEKHSADVFIKQVMSAFQSVTDNG